MQKWKVILLVAAILVQSFYCPVMAREARFLETAAPVLDLSAKSAVVMEQMKAEFLTLHSEEEEREFGEKMERFVASKSPEDRKILAQAFVNGAKESCERAEKLYDETLRVYLEGIYESISWSYVARHYFGKSRSWLCQRQR